MFKSASFFSVLFLLSIVSAGYADDLTVDKDSTKQTWNIAPLLPEHEKFRNDPQFVRFLRDEDKGTELVDEFTFRFNKAVFVCAQLGLKAPLLPIEREYCYQFVDFLEDPLCYDYLFMVSQTHDLLKINKMAALLAILEERLLFTQIYQYKAKERYEKQGLDSDTIKRTLDMIWQERYFFANLMYDPGLDRLLDHLPVRTEISDKLKEILLDRKFRVRLKMQEWGLVKRFFRNYKVERALYAINDQLANNPDIFAAIDFMKIYFSDCPDSDAYEALFDEHHLSRYFEHDLSLIDDIVIPDEIGLLEHVDVRAMYQKLLLFKYTSDRQRGHVRLCIKILMRACSGHYKEVYKRLAQQLFNEIVFDDIPNLFLQFPALLDKALSNPDDIKIMQLQNILTQLHNGVITTQSAEELLCSLEYDYEMQQ